jgi:DNA-binding MarR family transcriptional regulator
MNARPKQIPEEVETTAPDRLRTTREYLGHVFVGAAARLREATAQALAEHKLTPREFGLLNQAVIDPLLTQAQLGAYLGIDRTTMVAMVDRLVATGWLQRKADADDRRVYRIEATTEGAKNHLLAVAEVLAAEKLFLKPLSHEQSQVLTLALAQLQNASVSVHDEQVL